MAMKLIDFATWFQQLYRRVFRIEEFESSSILKWCFGAVLLFFFLSFAMWIGSTQTTIQTAATGAPICWPYFQNCGDLYFLQSLPEGYSQSIFYMVLYAVILLIILCMWKGSWALAHMLLTLLFLWKAFVIFVLSYLIAGPYDYYHLAFSLILLFAPFKEFFLKILFVVLYFLSALTKVDSTWILGTYFTTLQTGLPLFPDSLTPLFTNLVMLMQMIGAWFLLSRNWFLQRASLIFFVVFHLYSGIFVYYHYPSVSLPLLLILFGPMYRYTPIPFTWRALGGWVIVASLFVFQAPPLFIEGDRRLTLEGNRYGMFMFEANHQCVATNRTYIDVGDTSIRETHREVTPGSPCGGQTCVAAQHTYEEDGFLVREERRETGAAWNRCDPYVEWIRLKARCDNPAVEKVSLAFDHSINGGPFYRIVDEDDICGLTYKSFEHNAWIKLPPEAPIIGYPVKDEYRY
jgi:hypothetical protein